MSLSNPWTWFLNACVLSALATGGCFTTGCGQLTLTQQALNLTTDYAAAITAYLDVDDAGWAMWDKQMETRTANNRKVLVQLWKGGDLASVTTNGVLVNEAGVEVVVPEVSTPVGDMVLSVEKLMAAVAENEKQITDWRVLYAQRNALVRNLRAATALTETNAIAIKKAQDSAQAALRAGAEFTGAVGALAIGACVGGAY